MLRIVPHPDASKRSYRRKTASATAPVGTRMYRYVVTGTAEELQKYKAAAGQYYLEEREGKYAGVPIMNRRERFKAGAQLAITQDGRVAVIGDQYEEDLRVAYDKAKSFSEKVEDAIAGKIADRLMEREVAPAIGGGSIETSQPADDLNAAIDEAKGGAAPMNEEEETPIERGVADPNLKLDD